ncbi:MAG: efflux RND transporter periplasmic adaptor subunit [Parachlamydia sp.]|nr:efflux RND transporter periplasmic adaptor subunit [Parachlamydia sp.]
MTRYLKIALIVLAICAILTYVGITLAKVVPTTTPIVPPDLQTAPFKMYGVVEPAGRAVFISPPLQKRVEAILVHVGDPVKKGQPLMILDQVEEKARVARSLAEVQARKAELAISEDKWKRNKPLFAQQVVNEYDFMQSELDMISKRAQVEVAEKILMEAQAVLDQLTLKSPIDGKIYRQDVRLGEAFRPGDRSFIVGKDQLWVNLRVDSFWIDRVEKGRYKIYHADTKQYLGSGELIRTGLFMGPPNFYIEDPTVMVEIKYQEAFITLEPVMPNLPIELVVYAEKDK